MIFPSLSRRAREQEDLSLLQTVSKVVVVATDLLKACSEFISETDQPSRRLAVAELDRDYTVRVAASSVSLKQANQARRLALKGFTHEGILRIALKKQLRNGDQRNQSLIRQIVKQRGVESSTREVRSCKMLSKTDKMEQFTNALASQVCSSLYMIRELPFILDEPIQSATSEANLLGQVGNNTQQKKENEQSMNKKPKNEKPENEKPENEREKAPQKEAGLVQGSKQKGEETSPPRNIAPPNVQVVNPFLQSKTFDLSKIIKGEHRRSDPQNTVEKQGQQKMHQRNPAFDNPFSRHLPQKQTASSPSSVFLYGGNQQMDSMAAIPLTQLHPTGAPSLAGNVFICSKPSGGLFEDPCPKRVERKAGRRRKQETRVQ